MPLYEAILHRHDPNYGHNTIRDGVNQLIYSYKVNCSYLVGIVRFFVFILLFIALWFLKYFDTSMKDHVIDVNIKETTQSMYLVNKT